MHSSDISSALKKSGSSQRRIAALCGVDPTSVNKVVLAKSRSERIERAISEATQLPLHVLWPQFYSGSGAPEPKPSMGLEPNPLTGLLLAEFAKMDLAQQARLLQVAVQLTSGAAQLDAAARLARMNQGIEKLMADAANAPKRALAEATAELTKTIENVANAPQRALEKLASETGIQIDRNFGQVNKGGKNTFNKF